MIGSSMLFVACVFGTVTFVTANISQCYHCNSLYCGDPYDTILASTASCSDVFKNAKMYSSRIMASRSSSAALINANDSRVGADNSDDIEVIKSLDTNEVIRTRTHAEFFDIQRKIWEFFNKGEIDENTEFVCVKANYYTETGQTKIYRGCVPKRTKTISTACDFVSSKVVGSSSNTNTLKECYTCNTDLCNSGLSISGSIAALFMGVLLKLMF